MKIKGNRRLLILTALIVSFAFGQTIPESYCQTKNKTTQTARTKKNKGSSAKGKSSGKKKSAPTKKETVGDVRRKEAETRKEIALTQEQIRKNDLEVKRGLNELGKLQGDIAEGKVKLAKASGDVKKLDERIRTVSGNISKEEQELSRLREEYLKAVKKMRIKRKSTSKLAFIFSSKNFSEAMRRMRYLKQFAEWRDARSGEITNKVESLKKQKEDLGRAKIGKDEALKRESEAQKQLNRQYAEQGVVVEKLKANGEALKTHLANKQSEANVLKGRVASLIAEEQARAEAERKAKEAAERKERLAREEAARKAEADRKAQLAREEDARAEKNKKEAANKEAAKKEASGKDAGKENLAQNTPKNEEKNKSSKENNKEAKQKKQTKNNKRQSGKENNIQYADARKRRPRSQRNDQTIASVSGKEAEKSVGSAAVASAKKSVATSGDFSKMRGSLPKPVSGSFRITSPFGRHSLPDLPDVMYDNPGIDAEVAAGSNAKAVFEGRVSGVYVVPGFASVVIVSHGNYYTVYGNIQKPAVKVGDTVKQGSNLGRLAPEEDNPGKSSIHFEVWRNREKLDPAQWIR